MRARPFRLKTLSAALCVFPLVFICQQESAYISDQPRQGYQRERWENPEAILDTLDISEGMVIGEVGAGTGYFTFKLSERVGRTGRIYANDISSRALSTLRQRASYNGVENIEIIQGEVEHTRFPAASMDMVVMVYVFHELTEPVALMEDIKLCLKPGAQVVIIDGDHDRVRSGASHWLTREETVGKVEEAGYEVVRVFTFLPVDNIYVCRPRQVIEEPAEGVLVIP